MEYSTTRFFLNNEENKVGFNRKVDDGGNYQISWPYMLNGYGPVNESEMPFENNKDLIALSAIQNKEVVATVKDTINFPSVTPSDASIEDVKISMKKHIQDNGGIEAGIYGAELASDYYNNDTGAIYCNNTSKKFDHDVVIIG